MLVIENGIIHEQEENLFQFLGQKSRICQKNLEACFKTHTTDRQIHGNMMSNYWLIKGQNLGCFIFSSREYKGNKTFSN